MPRRARASTLHDNDGWERLSERGAGRRAGGRGVSVSGETEGRRFIVRSSVMLQRDTTLTFSCRQGLRPRPVMISNGRTVDSTPCLLRQARTRRENPENTHTRQNEQMHVTNENKNTFKNKNKKTTHARCSFVCVYVFIYILPLDEPRGVFSVAETSHVSVRYIFSRH